MKSHETSYLCCTPRPGRMSISPELRVSTGVQARRKYLTSFLVIRDLVTLYSEPWKPWRQQSTMHVINFTWFIFFLSCYLLRANPSLVCVGVALDGCICLQVGYTKILTPGDTEPPRAIATVSTFYLLVSVSGVSFLRHT